MSLHPDKPTSKRLLRLPAVKDRVGLSTTTIYTKIRCGEFPAPLKLSARAVCWQESVIDAWITERIKAGAK